MTAEEFIETQKMQLNKDYYLGYQITYANLIRLLNEYAKIKIIESNQ